MDVKRIVNSARWNMGNESGRKTKCKQKYQHGLLIKVTLNCFHVRSRHYNGSSQIYTSPPYMYIFPTHSSRASPFLYFLHGCWGWCEWYIFTSSHKSLPTYQYPGSWVACCPPAGPISVLAMALMALWFLRPRSISKLVPTSPTYLLPPTLSHSPRPLGAAPTPGDTLRNKMLLP